MSGTVTEHMLFSSFDSQCQNHTIILSCVFSYFLFAMVQLYQEPVTQGFAITKLKYKVFWDLGIFLRK